MNSFYGGQQGKSFFISEIFLNKVAMLNDLSQRWTSPVAVGELVLIAYGIPNDESESYITNKEADLQKFGKTYNSTLWQKIYTEETNSQTDELTGIEVEYVSGSYGFGYKLLAVLTGNTPQINLVDNTAILDADEMPYVSLNNDDIDKPMFTFYLPQPQVLKLAELKLINANQAPTVELDETNINRPTLEFSLPKAQIIGLSNAVEIDANEAPRVELDDSDINNPELTFYLPQSQIIELDDTVILGPGEEPLVEQNNNNINNPLLKFSLPRAVQFEYGDLLGESSQEEYVEEIPDSTLKIGDYYINKTTGFVYIVTEIDIPSYTFQFVACLSAPIPEIYTTDNTPYYFDSITETYVRRTAKALSSFADPVEQTGWQLSFDIPNNPNFIANYEFCGAADDGGLVAQPTSEENYTLSFTIPQGSRFFSGNEIFGVTSNVLINDALNGDYYLNTNLDSDYNGHIYLLNNSTWSDQGSIKGTTGKSINIVAAYSISSDTIADDTLELVSAYVYQEYGGYLEEDELIAVTYVDNNNNGAETAYWYYCIGETWGRAQLTGGVESLIKNEYDAEGNTNKAYSVTYINGLVSNEQLSANKQVKTYSAGYIEQLLQEQLSWGSF